LDRVGKLDRWTRFTLAVTFAAADMLVADRRAAVIIADLWRKAGYRPPVRCDAVDTDSGLSLAEAQTVAVRLLIRSGRARRTGAALRSGMSVRALLRVLCGVKAGPG
ncbi:MAG: hypothetical protein NTW28_00020, partial [Candidatus Solibacter sp.]|nr:hypothetical protein [Candidatus Solibacter sp.]